MRSIPCIEKNAFKNFSAGLHVTLRNVQKWNFTRFFPYKTAPSDPRCLKMGVPTWYCSQAPTRKGIFKKVQLPSEIRAAACWSVRRRRVTFYRKSDRLHSNASGARHSPPIWIFENCGESPLNARQYEPKKSKFDRDSGAWRCSEVPRNEKK